MLEWVAEHQVYSLPLSISMLRQSNNDTNDDDDRRV